MRTQILKYLEKNSRVDLGELAVLLGTEEALVANEIADMESEGIIVGYHTLINWEKAGADVVNALIEVSVTPQREQGYGKTADRISKYPEVEAVYLISGGFDYLVMMEGKTLKEISRFVSEKLSTIGDITNIKTHFILEKYKDHGTVLVSKAKEERIPVSF